MPPGVDILLFGALVGYSAYGGFGNNCLTNWYRDKGYGMAGKIGYIASAFGGKEVHVSPSGSMPPPTKENVEHFKGWWKLLNFDQWAIFWVGGMLGMALPGLLYVSQIAPGTTLPQLGHRGRRGAAVRDAGPLHDRRDRVLDPVLQRHEQPGSGAAAMHRHALVRVPAGRATLAKNDIRKVYYALLIAVLIWGTIYVNITLPIIILAISANVANFTMALSAIMTVIVNRKFLPKEFRPTIWREVIMVDQAWFSSGFFFTLFVLTQFFGVKLN